jgi:hypothetical protein
MARQLVLGVARLDLNLSPLDLEEQAISKSIKTMMDSSVYSSRSPLGGTRKPDYALYLQLQVREASNREAREASNRKAWGQSGEWHNHERGRVLAFF